MTDGPARERMEVAIEVMRRSVADRRTDKACPSVGAVIVLPDGTVETACRGELREGDHAEYTLIDKKLRDRDLTGSEIFATLEPCAPESRGEGKTPCAMRIVAARIAKVWVGITDPDPTVDRRGIKYLQENGVEVAMFDPDLQEDIKRVNEMFLKQALERADDVKGHDEVKVKLSTLDETPPHVAYGDLSLNALDRFRKAANITDAVESVDFRRRLERLGLLVEEGNDFKPTKSGLILFGDSPRETMPQVSLQGTIHHLDGTEEAEDFDGPQTLVPARAMDWLRDRTPVILDRTRADARSRDDSLFRSVREGVVNALVHRDYDIIGAKSQLVIRPDTIEIRSPGPPQDPITLEQMQHFRAPMLSRNPLIHYVFRRMNLAEERGLGLETMRRSLSDAGLPAPTYTFLDPYLVLTIFRSTTAVTAGLPSSVAARMTEFEMAGWSWLRRQFPQWVQTPQYAEVIGRDVSTARRDLGKFVELGLAEKRGQTRGRKYRAKLSVPEQIRAS